MCSPARSILILRGRGHIWGPRGGEGERNSSTVMEIHCGHPCSFVTVFILQMSHARVCRLLSRICRCSFFRLHQSVFILSYLDKQLLSFSSFAISPLIDVSHPSPASEKRERRGREVCNWAKLRIATNELPMTVTVLGSLLRSDNEEAGRITVKRGLLFFSLSSFYKIHALLGETSYQCMQLMFPID